MSKVHATIGRGVKVHAILDGSPVCGAKGNSINIVEAERDCKNCDRLIGTMDTIKETEKMDEHLNTMTDAGRFDDAMTEAGYDVEMTSNDETGMRAVVTRATFPSGTRITTRAVWHNGVFSYGRHVVVDALGHHVLDLSESEVASMTYSRNYAAEVA